MRWSHLSIGQRLGLGFVLLLLINAASLVAVGSFNRQSVDAERAFTTQSAPRLEGAITLRARILEVAIAARAVQIAPTPQNRLGFSSDLQRARQQVERMAEMNAGNRAFTGLTQQINAYLIEAEQTIDEQLGDDAQNALRDRRLAFTPDLEEYIAQQRRDAGAAMNAMSTAQQRVRDGVVAAAIVSMLAFVLIAFVIAESVRRPARVLSRAARAMADGDWKPALELPVHPEDSHARNELVQLRSAFSVSAAAIELRERRLGASRAVASAAAAGLSTELIAQCALQAIGDHVNAELGVVYACETGGRLLPVASRGLGLEVHELPDADGVPRESAIGRRTIRLADVPADTNFTIRIGFDRAPARSVISVPLVFRDRVLGVFVLASLRTIDDDDASFLESAAQQLAIGFENVRSFEQIGRLLEQTTEANARIQAQSEELQAQNEELQAQGEEIQVQNEELQAQGEEIRAQNEDLRLQSETLRSQREALTEVDKRKNEFIGLLAHELRNPLATMSNSLFVLRQVGSNQQPAARTLDVMERQMRQLQRLTDDLLDITRIAHGKLKLRRARVDLADVVRECVEDQRVSASRAKVGLTLTSPEQPIFIEGDRSRLSQVLCNLIDNAMKASREDSEVQIAVQLHASPARATVSIIDQGEGITKEVLPTLFRPFVQAFGSHRSNGGLGLGLSLVRTITGMHGGTVEAFSEGAGHGSTFVVTLPLESPESVAQDSTVSSDAHTEQGDPDRSSGACRIQLIEDNEDAAETLRFALELAGHNVSVAHTAESGLEMLRVVRPDVLICDIGLPDKSGYEVAAALANDPEFTTTRLVALSGYATPSDQRRARDAGFHHHFAKPVTIEQLGTVLKPSTGN